MGSKPDFEAGSAPKLSLFSLPNKSPEHPGMLTPPLRAPASVPFLWEEEPGKPRSCTTTLFKTGSARCLELPPRLLIEAKMNNMSSPTTVLDGPYVGRSASCSSTFGRERERSFGGSPERGQLGAIIQSRREMKGRGYFGSWGRRVLKGNRDGGEASSVVSPSSSSSSYAVGGVKEVGDRDGGGTTKVKLTRLRRSGSFLSLSHTKSHLWASIYESFKQVVPWRSRKMKKNDGLIIL